MVLFITSTLLKDRADFSKIWLAAHWERKLKRYQIFKVDIEGSVRDMIDKNITLDLRLSGHLLIGIVKIFSRKTKYLLIECSDIFFQVKIYKSNDEMGLPSNKMRACLKDITFPELKNVDEFFQDNHKELEKHQSRTEEITLKETCGNLAPDEEDYEMGVQDEKFSQELENEILKSFEGYKKDAKKPKKASNQMINTDINCEKDDVRDSEEDIFGGLEIMDISESFEERKETVGCRASISMEPIPFHTELFKSSSDEELNLEPLPETSLKTTSRRKRKLIIDQVKILNPEKLKKQLCNTSDITIPFEMAPPTKRLMTLKEIGCAEKLFKLPGHGHRFCHKDFLNLYTRNLKVYKAEANVSSCEEETFIFPSPEQPRAAPTQNDIDENLEMNEIENFHLTTEQGITEQGTSRHNLSPFNMEECVGDMYKCPPDHEDLVQNEASSDGSQDVLEKRMARFLSEVQESLQRSKEIKFSEMVGHEKRMKVARKFQAMLMLKKLNAIEIKQAKPYEEIFISKGGNFSPACSQFV